MGSAWQQVSSIMQRAEQRCALVIANANLMQGGEMLMTELNTFRSARHSVVISIFRETTIQNVSQWDSFARSVLEPRMNTNDPERNRVISLASPNCREIRNLLNHFRIEPSPRLKVESGDIHALGELLADSCARNNWGLTDLITRLTGYAARQEETLSLRNWQAFIGEENHRPALEQLTALVGQDTIKNRSRNGVPTSSATPPVGASLFPPAVSHRCRPSIAGVASVSMCVSKDRPVPVSRRLPICWGRSTTIWGCCLRPMWSAPARQRWSRLILVRRPAWCTNGWRKPWAVCC